jgi:hypothetical protein
MPVGNSMSRKLALLSVGRISRRAPTRRRAVSWRVGPSSSTRKTSAPFDPCRCAAVLLSRGIAQINYARPRCLGPSGDIATDRRDVLTARWFSSIGRVDFTALCASRQPSASRPLPPPATAREPGREASRAARRVESARQVPEKRREAEACAAVCREVTRAEALPEAVLVDRSDAASQ